MGSDRSPGPGATAVELPAGTVPTVSDLALCEASGDAIAAADLYAALRLRSEVFVVEQACVYLDLDGRDLEPTTTHLWLATPDGDIAAYLRLMAEPAGGSRIGRVVTAPAHRGRALASQLIEAALERVERPVLLGAQSHLQHVYARHGFLRDGDDYLEDGIWHTPMRLG